MLPRVLFPRRASQGMRAIPTDRHALLSHFGNTGLAGHGKTPKVYFLTRKGWEILVRESDIPAELIGDHKQVHVDVRWSPQMYHRLRTVDLMISAEIAVRKRPHLTMVKSFLEYRMVKRGSRIERETTDYVADEQVSDNRIVPDAVLSLRISRQINELCSSSKWIWQQNDSSLIS